MIEKRVRLDDPEFMVKFDGNIGMWDVGKVQFGVEPSDEALTHVRELRAAADARVAHGRPLRPPDSSTGAIDLSAPATLLPVAARGDDGAANADAAALPSSATGGGEPPKPPADDFPPVASGDLPDPAEDSENPADVWLKTRFSEHEHYRMLFELRHIFKSFGMKPRKFMASKLC